MPELRFTTKRRAQMFASGVPGGKVRSDGLGWRVEYDDAEIAASEPPEYPDPVPEADEPEVLTDDSNRESE